MKKKSSFFAVGLLVATFVLAGVITAAQPAPAASAAPFTGDESEITVTENSASYEYLKTADGDYGCKLTFNKSGATASFAEPIELSEATELIRLVMLPSETNAAQAKADLDSFIVRIEQEDDEDKWVEITVNTMVDVFPANGLVALYAQASGQAVAAGEVGQSFGTAEAGYDGSDWIRTFGGNVKQFSFTDRSSNVLSLCYDNTDNRVYVGDGAQYNGYGPTVRRLSHAYTDPFPDGNTYGFVNDDKTFAGFDAGKKVKLSITAGALINNATKAEILVYGVGGRRAVSPLIASAPSLAAAGGTYAVPVPVSYSTGRPVSVPEATYTVTAPSGDTVASGTVSDAAPFATEEAGAYTIAYESGGHTAELTVTAVSKSDAQSIYPLAFTEVFDDYAGLFVTPGGTFPLRASAESGLDLAENTVTITATVTAAGGSSETVAVAADGSTVYEAGGTEETYTVVYTATDYTGRTLTSEPVEVRAAWAQVGFAAGTTAADFAPIGGDSPLYAPAKDDIIVYDPRCVGMTGDYIDVAVSVRAPSAEDFVPYTAAYAFDELGVYTIRYEFSYTYGGVENASSVTRTLTVYDPTPPAIIADGMPGNAAAHPELASSGSNVYLKAKTGLAVRLPEVRAVDTAGTEYDLTDTLIYTETAPDGTVTDKTADYRAAERYTFTPASAGTYVLRFEATDSAGLKGVLNYVLDVRDNWYLVRPARALPETAASSAGLTVPQASVTDFFGAAVNGAAKVELYRGETLVDGSAAGKTFVDLAPGVYRIEYSFASGGETSDVFGAEVTVADDTLPEISVSGGADRGRVGKCVPLAGFTATDNDLLVAANIRVLLGETEINVYDGAFRPDKAGEYTVVITAEDVSGNVAEARYTVTVTGGLPGWAIALIVVGAVLVAAAIAVAVVLFVRIRLKAAPSPKRD